MILHGGLYGEDRREISAIVVASIITYRILFK